MANSIKSNTTLTSRSICDYNCIFSLEVISRKGNFATIKYMNQTRRTKVYSDRDGNEYLQPDKHSMSPIFSATN
jgi:hypothetical protein